MIFWSTVIVATLLFFIFRVFPMAQQWQEKTKTLDKMEHEITTMENEKEAAKKQLSMLQSEFDATSAPYMIEENQLLPKTVDIEKISKVLELYSLQLQLLDPNSTLDITNLSFSGTQKLKNEKVARTGLTISCNTTETDLKKFIDFLQTGKLTTDFETGKETGRVKMEVYEYLMENLLPIIHIESLNISTEKEKTNIFKTTLRITLFSQN